LILLAATVLLARSRDLLGVLLEKQGDCPCEELETDVLLVLALTAGFQELFKLLVGGLAVVVHHLFEQDLERFEIHVCLAK